MICIKPMPIAQKLREQDPRLIWRGPPGTHDVELGIELLDQLRGNIGSVGISDSNQEQHYISIPQFDKAAFGGAGDRRDPLQINLKQNPIDIVLFEGWFVGVLPCRKLS
jgi:D-glycerate 3-kinase